MQRSLCLLGLQRQSYTEVEADAIEFLGAAYVSTDKDDAKAVPSMAAVVERLEPAIQVLGVPKASRSYRKAFNANYKTLLPHKQRFYHSLVLEACLDQQESIWINGQSVCFRQSTLTAAAELRSSWQALGHLLRRWSEARHATKRPPRAEFVTLLTALDRSWAAFERRHITELMDVENRARSLVGDAAAADRLLVQLEEPGGSLFPLGEDTMPKQRRVLIAAIARLNAVANTGGKGRADFSSDVLEVALKHQGQGAGAVLAEDLRHAFFSLRWNLRSAAENLDELDPWLNRNTKLASALEDFEKSWEVAEQYLWDPAMLHLLSGAVDDLTALQRAVPAYKLMCEQCGVELFLLKPRLLWLSFFARPALGLLLEPLLPDHFERGEPVSDQLRKLVAEHGSLVERLGSSSWETLASYVVRKSISDGASMPLLPGVPFEVQGMVDAFLLQLESWSMELQRHRAQDWNCLVEVLVHCLEHA